MDPTDARRIVRDLAARAGVDPDAVLGRDRTVAHFRRHAMLELRRKGLSNRQIAKVFRRVPGTVGEVLQPWRVGSSGRRKRRHIHAWRLWRPDHQHPHAGDVKSYLEEWAAQLERSGSIGELVELPLNLSAASGETTLVAATAGRRIVVVSLDLTPAAALTFAIWSGTVAAGTRITGDIVGNAGGQYVWLDKITHADNVILNINRGSAVAISGSLTYRLL